MTEAERAQLVIALLALYFIVGLIVTLIFLRRNPEESKRISKMPMFSYRFRLDSMLFMFFWPIAVFKLLSRQETDGESERESEMLQQPSPRDSSRAADGPTGTRDS